MGNRSNLVTLRYSNILQYGRLYLQEFIYNYEILKLITLLFSKKKIFLVKSSMFLVENKIFLTFFLFFRVAALSLYAKAKKHKTLLKKNFSSIFKSFKLFKKNLIVFTIVNLNFFLKKKKKKNFFFF